MSGYSSFQKGCPNGKWYIANGKWHDVTANGGVYCTKLPPAANLPAGFQYEELDS